MAALSGERVVAVAAARYGLTVSARHVIKRMFNPRCLSLMSSDDVPSYALSARPIFSLDTLS